jgi:predicted nucleic acid-binding protein
LTHLDASFLVHALRRGTHADARLRGWLVSNEPLGISAMAWTEFCCGPLKPQELAIARRLVAEPEPVCADDAERAAMLFNDTGRRRGSLADCLIAAVALRLNAPLATDNVADFRRFEAFGLRVLAEHE